MLKNLYPKMYISKISGLPVKRLKKLNIDTLLFDIDNTLAPYYEATPNETILEFITELKNQGFKVGLFSNAKEKRVTDFNSELQVYAFHKAYKPVTRNLKAALEKMNSTPSQSAIIGDQIFTDVWCGNRGGLFSILVKPMVTKDEWVTGIKRGVERIVINSYLKHKGELNEHKRCYTSNRRNR